MQRTRAAYTVAGTLILTLVVTVADNVSAHTRPAHPAGGPERVRACGVERWAVKIGIDPDARLVNQKVVIPTTIIHLRSLPAPRFLPLHSRLRPVETTVWAVDAILLRYRVEEDSDVHLVVHTVGSSGVVSWTWHMASRGTGGTATVTCSFGGQTKSAVTNFSIS
jgi:hypothetical protein